MSTHLGNGAHPQIKRHPNYIWDQLAEDRLTASLITDGCHLPPSVVKSMLRAKTPSRCVIVSDVTAMGGMPPGRYETGLGAQEVLEDGRLVVAGQRDILAGASFLIHHCVANVPRFTGLSWQSAIELASTQPAALFSALPAEDTPFLTAFAPFERVFMAFSNSAFAALLTWASSYPIISSGLGAP